MIPSGFFRSSYCYDEPSHLVWQARFELATPKLGRGLGIPPIILLSHCHMLSNGKRADHIPFRLVSGLTCNFPTHITSTRCIFKVGGSPCQIKVTSDVARSQHTTVHDCGGARTSSAYRIFISAQMAGITEIEPVSPHRQ